MTNPAVPPSVTYPSPNEWPNQVRTVSAITREAQATVTSSAHGFNAQDVGVTFLTFKNVAGMQQINGLTGTVVRVLSADDFVVSINTTTFSPYSSGGVFIIDSGVPPLEKQGSQFFNTPFQNTFP